MWPGRIFRPRSVFIYNYENSSTHSIDRSSTTQSMRFVSWNTLDGPVPAAEAMLRAVVYGCRDMCWAEAYARPRGEMEDTAAAQWYGLDQLLIGVQSLRLWSMWKVDAT
ncbi:Uncharacterized protein LW94_10642 [Fusarium fujikuroi]|uniref:Uncharacterized protein n=1 Tax=Fusarium fujikuroi TaxID=5127 RepID=A0A9Q9S039_FUSFU|nr:Uncharacterized protein Y057_8619 [Fusarium fujikuroi]KLP16186.1 Uncharacterized protein LW94_10642 [Fusarium fujikuroi]VTT72340.1 unnamed protein product [Fusarium fujikuroi]VTT83994.1 unnamed protein product [Fusarium fujikuroi]VZH95190.1 unnamed protein product [Fusarium fujikuroi]